MFLEYSKVIFILVKRRIYICRSICSRCNYRWCCLEYVDERIELEICSLFRLLWWRFGIIFVRILMTIYREYWMKEKWRLIFKIVVVRGEGGEDVGSKIW